VSGLFFYGLAGMVIILYLMIVVLGAMRRSRDRASLRSSLRRERDCERDSEV
jgi:hypothetical protein